MIGEKIKNIKVVIIKFLTGYRNKICKLYIIEYYARILFKHIAANF